MDERILIFMNALNSKESIQELIEGNEMVLLYFGSESCNVCSALKPKVDEMLKSYPNIKSIQIDVEKELVVSAQFNAFTIPVILLFVDGKEIIREARHISIDDLNYKIGRYYELYYGE